MAKNNEAVDREALSIDQAIWELVNRVYPSLMDTYEKLKAVDPVAAEKYRKQMELKEALEQIKTNTEQARANTDQIRADMANSKKKGRGLWNALWHGLGVAKSEGDKLFKE